MLAESGWTRRISTPTMRKHPPTAKREGTGFGRPFLRAAAILLAFLSVLCACSSVTAQTPPGKQQPKISPPADESGSSASAEQELQTGTELTRQGHFREAIPHFLAAQGRVSNEFAADFNLALCYFAHQPIRQSDRHTHQAQQRCESHGRRLRSSGSGLCWQWPARASVYFSSARCQPSAPGTKSSIYSSQTLAWTTRTTRSA